MEAINHESRKHTLLSASGASRWMNCTPSARLEEKFQASTSSYAEEGTLAHELADLILRYTYESLSRKVYNTELAKIEKNPYAPEMLTEVEKYVAHVIEFYNLAKKRTPGAKLLIEQKLDFSHLVEKGFGTGDVCIIADGILDIIDLKYGKGVRVDAEGNSQLMLYGSGALRAFEMLYDIHTVRLTIIQPRLDHVSTWEITAKELEAWGEDMVKPKAAEAYKGEGKQVAGDWCKFCKAKAMCKTLAAKNMELAKHDFEDPHLLDEKDLLEIFKQQPMLVDWVNAVSEYLLSEAIKGKKWDGYKLVEGRSNRKWLDEERVINTLIAEGYKLPDFTSTKIKGLGEIEKLVPKSRFHILTPLIIKPPGAPTLVPLADKRPAIGGIEQAKDDFK
jgi:hypothetical protein